MRFLKLISLHIAWIFSRVFCWSNDKIKLKTLRERTPSGFFMIMINLWFAQKLFAIHWVDINFIMYKMFLTCVWLYITYNNMFTKQFFIGKFLITSQKTPKVLIRILFKSNKSY